MKCVAIGGVPATGKTTLMKNIINILQPKKKFKYGLLRGYIQKDISILGVYKANDVFAGTDKLSMAVQKDYQKYIDKIMMNTIFEGDRLFTKNNLLDICKKYETKIIILENDKQTLQERHIERGDNQSEKFKKGRATKINNIELELELQPYITKYKLNSHKESEDLAKVIVRYLNL
tara:strand:- start:7017 stop:7544 length:528 start_codon:yes stop_codon:yes gene_type:complete